MIWWWQFNDKNNAWTPEFTDKFSQSVKIKSIHAELLVFIRVGCFINWENSFEEVNGNNFDSCVVLMPLGYQEEDLALNSPVITDKDSLPLLMSLKSFSKLDKSRSNSVLFWLGER